MEIISRNSEVKKVHIEFIQIREIKDDEYQIASEITKSCKGYSRGYEGETSEWFKAWTECKDSSVFMAEMKNEIVGVCCG